MTDASPAAATGARYGHTNLIARDWRAVADFYAQAREAVVNGGGGTVGEVVTLQTADDRRVTWCYVTDPEGNIVELQSWAPAT